LRHCSISRDYAVLSIFLNHCTCIFNLTCTITQLILCSVTLALEDWDIIAPVEIPTYRMPFLDHRTFLGNLTGSISNRMEKTVSHMQKVIGKAHITIPFVPPRLADQFKSSCFWQILSKMSTLFSHVFLHMPKNINVKNMQYWLV